MVKVTCVSLAFRHLDDANASSFLARQTAALTCSSVTHVEVIFTVQCPGLDSEQPCMHCHWLRNLPAQSKKQMRGHMHCDPGTARHNLSFTVTGVPGRDTVYMTVNRLYNGGTSNYSVYSHEVKSRAQMKRAVSALGFLNTQLDRPFDSKAFFLNSTLMCCFPQELQFGCPLLRDYKEWKGGWTCSGLACAALASTKLLPPNLRPGSCTPAQLEKHCRKSPYWLHQDSEPSLGESAANHVNLAEHPVERPVSSSLPARLALPDVPQNTHCFNSPFGHRRDRFAISQ